VTLGKGAEVERQNRLRDLANRQAAQDVKEIAHVESESTSMSADALIATGLQLGGQRAGRARADADGTGSCARER